jgi:hypothetical protein
MGSTSQRINATLEASTIRWGKLHCRSVQTVADSSGSLNDTYFDLNGFDPNLTEDPFYVWFNVNSAGTDPTIAGKTGIEVAVATDATAAEVATALKAAIDADTNNRFRAIEIVGDTVTIENRFIGAVTAETDAGATGFTFTELVAGVGIDLGATADAIELTIGTEVADITSNQTGAIIGSQIYQGATAELTANLIEVTKERFDLLVGEVTGGSVTPVGGTKVSGYGEARLFADLAALGGNMILHPIRLPADDYSADVVFWKSAPKPESLNFDGTAPQQLSTVFTAYLDRSKDPRINLFARGDWTQEGLNA